MKALGIDESIWFQKPRHTRMLLTGGIVAENSIQAMAQEDDRKEAEGKAEIKRRNKGRGSK